MTAKQLAIGILVLAIIRAGMYFFPNLGQVNIKMKRLVLEYMDSIIIAGVAALFIIHFLFRTFYIPSGSMLPTLQIKDFIVVNEFVYRFKQPERGEIVVFTPPPSANAEGKDFIKRVVAKGGDTVEVKDGRVYVNNEPQPEPFVQNPPDYYMGPTTVPEGHLFVMGDNRPSSADSHIWGFLPEKNVIGKAFLVILPPQRVRVLK